MATMISGLGGTAGYGEQDFKSATKAAGDNVDGAVQVNVTSVFENGINIGGTTYNDLYIGSNGVISFGTPVTDYIPDLNGTSPVLSPFWTDNDITRSSSANVYWDFDTANDRIIITYDNVTAWSTGTPTSTTNSFQVVLTDTGGGNFDVEYIYGDINFTDGSSGTAQTGINDGTTVTTLEGSGNNTALLDYENNDFDGGDPNGTTSFNFVNGAIDNRDFVVDGTTSNDYIDLGYTDANGDQIDANDNQSGTNADSIVAGVGNDTVYGGNGSDTIDGGEGADLLYGGGFNQSSTSGTNTISTQFEVFSLGNFADVDPDESNSASENAGNLLTTFGGTLDPLYDKLVEMDTSGTTGDNIVADNDLGRTPETFQLDGASATLDSTQVYNATITYDDGTIAENVSAVVFQTTDGNVYWAPELSLNADHGSMVPKPIVSVTFDSVLIASTDLNNTRVDANYKTLVSVPDTDGDSILGGTGSDTIFGELGNDTLDGGTQNDLVFGQEGNDNLVGGDGGDTLDGGVGDDTLRGDSGDDSILGGTGDDLITGSIGLDTLQGDDGNDTFNVAEGDSAVGGAGDDVFVLQDYSETGSAAITIDGGDEGSTDTDVLNLNGVADVSTLVTSASADPGAFDGTVTLLDGSVVTFTNIEQIICFTPSTLILTPEGERPIESLKPGDLIMTKDAGAQPLRWVGKSTVSGQGNFAPIRLSPSVTGGNAPLLVSPQHRMLISDWRAELYFEDSEIFVPATQMTAYEGVEALPCDQVTYIHLLLDTHHVITANGAETESFFLGEESLKALHPIVRSEIKHACPDLMPDEGSFSQTARRSLKAFESRVLLDHIFTRKSDARPRAA